MTAMGDELDGPILVLHALEPFLRRLRVRSRMTEQVKARRHARPPANLPRSLLLSFFMWKRWTDGWLAGQNKLLALRKLVMRCMGVLLENDTSDG